MKLPLGFLEFRGNANAFVAVAGSSSRTVATVDGSAAARLWSVYTALLS